MTYSISAVTSCATARCFQWWCHESTRVAGSRDRAPSRSKTMLEPSVCIGSSTNSSRKFGAQRRPRPASAQQARVTSRHDQASQRAGSHGCGRNGRRRRRGHMVVTLLSPIHDVGIHPVPPVRHRSRPMHSHGMGAGCAQNVQSTAPVGALTFQVTEMQGGAWLSCLSPSW
jgi:hypothetical protein